MENPNADTEWNDTLRKFHILPPKEKEAEFTEEDVINLVETTVKEKTVLDKPFEDMTLEELEACEDDEDERVLQEYRRKRLLEMQQNALKSKFGEVMEISGEDYIREVNKAGEDVWVVLHLYQQGVPLCTLINQHLSSLARKFPQTKFLKSISTMCIKNYPDKNLPAVFVYCAGNMKKQFVGPHEFGGMNLTVAGLEWMLSETGAIKTDLEAPAKKEIKDVLFSSLQESSKSGEIEDGSDDENDWQY